jgi:hypothetical protein
VKKHLVLLGTAVIALTGVLSTLPLRAAAQGVQPSAEAIARRPPVKAGPVKHLPDGTPDIRGTWTKVGGGLNEANRPATDLKPFGPLAEPEGFRAGGVVFAGPGGAEVEARVPKYLPNPRPPQGIVDPPDRVLPYTPEGLATRLDFAKNMCCPAKSFDYVEISMRCPAPNPWSGGGVHILQRTGQVTLLFESNHYSRVIYTDGRPHPSPAMRFFGGHSTGRWEGDTLVVDTTNLDGRAYFGVGVTIAPFSRELHLTERYTVVSDKLITFELIYDDPKTFTRPVKSVGFLYPYDEDEELVPEVTCHEGSYALPNIFGF